MVSCAANGSTRLSGPATKPTEAMVTSMGSMMRPAVLASTPRPYPLRGGVSARRGR